MVESKPTTVTEHSITFQIMGDNYAVKGSDKPEDMQAIVNYLESVIESIRSTNPKLMKSQVAVLAALKIADELFKLRQEYQCREQRQPNKK